MITTESLEKPSLIATPPWTLTGNGVILVYHFSEKFVSEHGFLESYQHESYKGFVGSVMLVDYKTSPVGPYSELLFIPGFFELRNQNTFSISKIYVSSYESVWNGITNWGIPKEQATFDISEEGRVLKFKVDKNGQDFFEATIQKGIFSFPITTAFTPLKITQLLENDLILTKPSAKGKAYFGTLKNIKINSDLFPNFCNQRLLSTLVVENFEMKFPIPIRSNYEK